MLIIDKNKDFYDYFSNIYGVDNQIVFDRRGSIPLTSSYFESYLVENRWWGASYFLLEVGYIQYLIKAENVKVSYKKHLQISTVDNYDLVLAKIFKEQVHLFPKEISIVSVSIPYQWRMKEEKVVDSLHIKDIKYVDNGIRNLPIIKDTKLTSILDPFELWKEISTFISSQKNDKNVDIINTDKDKIINHGFDVKTSFRNPIKL